MALGPLFLGTLYCHLDLMQECHERSLGRYNLVSYLDTMFLHMFIYEHFPHIAPIPKPYSAFCKDIYESDDEDNFRLDGEGKKNKKRDILLRMDRRSETRSPGNLGLVIDLEKEFCFRPYMKEYSGIAKPFFYPS